MKKHVLVLLVLAAIAVVGASASHASEFASSPATNDTMTVLDKSQLDGYDHAVITYNYVDDTAFGVVLDPDGFSDAYYGYAYFFADYSYNTLYGCASFCDNPANWDNLGGI